MSKKALPGAVCLLFFTLHIKSPINRSSLLQFIHANSQERIAPQIANPHEMPNAVEYISCAIALPSTTQSWRIDSLKALFVGITKKI